MKIDEIVGKSTPKFLAFKEDTNRPLPTGAIGIEIELEDIRLKDEKFKYWNVTGDGSLQNGIEFVSRPICGDQISKALNEIDIFLKTQKPYVSFRTSVHVHVNVLDMDHEHLSNLIKMYVLYEPALFRIHKEWDRYDNIFCVPSRKSYAIQEAYGKLLGDLEKKTVRGHYVGYKYSALNPNPITDYGTIEFRHMGGTTDMKAIDSWVNILLQLKLSSSKEYALEDSKSIFGDYLGLLDIHENDIISGNHILDGFSYLQSSGEF